MDQHLASGNGDEVVRGLSRKDFMKVLAAAGVAITGSGLAAGPAAAQTGTGTEIGVDPRDLRFTIRAQYRPFDIVSPNFVEHRDRFDSRTQAYRRLAPAPERNLGTVRVGGGALSVRGEDYFALFRTGTGPVAPYGAVQVEVEAFSGQGEERDTVYAGLIRDSSNFVMASYNRATGLVAIDVTLRGRRNRLNQATVELSGPMTFSFVLNENNVTALADTGDGPRPLLRSNVAAEIDLRDPDVLPRYRFGFGVRGEGGSIRLGGVEAGYWGKAGVRDPHVVTFADGTPYIVDGKVYLTMTNAGLGFFQSAHWGVYTLDLADVTSPDALEEVGKIFFRRRGRLLGDHAGHVVYDDSIDAFRVLASTWGDFSGNGVRITSAEFRGDLLNGVHVIREPEILPLPTELSRWDPHLVRIDARWYVAFVESPSQTPFRFYPALARTRRGARELDGFTLVGRDTSRTETEGMVMQKVGGTWYVFASSSAVEGETGDRYRIYDLGLRFIGYLNAPNPTNIPHPMLFPVPVPTAGGSTRFLLVTFNGTQFYEPVLGYGTHGDFFVMEADELIPGYEFPPRSP